jgi:CRISPR-associated endonuclease/helicase Cas3
MGLRAHLIDGAELILQAHTGNKASGGEPELLIDHSNLVLEFVDKLCEENGLAEAVRRAIEQTTIMDEPLCDKAQVLINNWFRQAIYLHDLGKVNPVFQRKRMRNKNLGKLVMSGDSNHALLSGLLYLHIYLPELETKEFSQNSKKNELICNVMRHFLYTFAYVISYG